MQAMTSPSLASAVAALKPFFDLGRTWSGTSMSDLETKVWPRSWGWRIPSRTGAGLRSATGHGRRFG